MIPEVVNKTLLPLHTVAAAVAIVTLGVTVPPTASVKPLLVAVLLVWQTLFAVITQVIISLLATSTVVKTSVELVAPEILVPFFLH